MALRQSRRLSGRGLQLELRPASAHASYASYASRLEITCAVNRLKSRRSIRTCAEGQHARGVVLCLTHLAREARMTVTIGRRELLAALGGAAAAWLLAARAPQSERVRRIGALMYLAADDPESPARVAAFARGLQELGWIEGRNIQIEYRWGGGDMDRVRRYAAELVA